ncbi:MAG: antibiotic biosynthesis monooxygenase [Coxiella sp. (in: Bacteria)]|nr:MAG: antibiotic biosynthesis monooxygenase [Coxiella sp. (in: g-proteobacteria)]
MYCVLFKSQLNNPDDPNYEKMAEKMLALAQQQPGVIDFAHYLSADSDSRMSIIHFESEEAISAWKNNVKHQVAQKLGKEKWYKSYQVEICDVLRSYGND